MQSEVQKQNFTYDVFLSYSRRDIEFVKLLEKELNDYVPSNGQHRLSVFRDEGKITGNEYYRSIERALRQSRKLILVASPNAYKSQFVNDEVRDFIRMKGSRNVFVILLSGKRKNELQPGQEELRAVPEVLGEVMREPLDADYRDFDLAQGNLITGRHKEDWRRLLEHIYSDELAPTPEEEWDIFISYALADAAFAGHLEKELEKYAPPKDLALEHNLPIRTLKVFRDEDDATRDDTDAIRKALESSKQMFLLCSPHARDDKRVRGQVAQFAGLQGAERIIRVLVAGEPALDSTESAFPVELCQWIKEPSYTDYRGFKVGKDKISNGAFSGHWATLLATHYQVKREELEQRERKRQSRNRRIAGSIVIGVVAILLTALGFATRGQNLAIVERGKAVLSQLAAEYEKVRATWASEDATQAADIAEKRRQEAEEQRQEAERQKNVADEQRRMAEARLYVANMLRAQEFFAQNNFTRAEDFLLASYPISDTPEKDDLRSFDWFYLWRQMHNENVTLKINSAVSINSVAFSRDGQTIAFVGNDRTVLLWDVASRQVKRILKGHTDQVTSVAFSSDIQILASGSADKTVKLWDVASGQVKATLNGHDEEINSVAFAPDGQTVASGSDDESVKLWDVSSGRVKVTLKHPGIQIGTPSRVNSVAFAPDGLTLASGGDDETIKLWDVASGREITTLEVHDRVRSIAFALGRRMLASGQDDGSVKL